MKILFLNSLYKQKHFEIYKIIKGIFNELNFTVFEVNSETKYDLIFIFNNLDFKLIKKLSREMEAPVIYCFLQSDICREYKDNLELINKVLIFQDLLTDGYLPPLANLEWIPFLIGNTSINHQDRTVSSTIKKVFVEIDNDFLNNSLLLRMIKFFNNLDGFEIYIFCDIFYENFFNSDITILKKEEKEEYFKNADIILGSGNIIFKGLINQKLCCVVGERGYGGIVTIRNLEYHLKNLFQGRNGGTLDEHIPVNLILDDLQNGHVDLFERKQIQQSVLRIKDEIEEKITEVFLETKFPKLSENKSYRLSLNFELINDGNDSYSLLNCISRNKLYTFSRYEYFIISQFNQSKTVDLIINIFKLENRSIILSFIEAMLIEGVLVETELN